MIKKRPYLLLLFSAVLFLVQGLFITGESTIDVNVHDTYFVVAHSHLCWLSAEILGILTLIYCVLEIAKVTMISILTKIHVYGTLISILGLFFPYSFFFPDSNFPLYDNAQNSNVCLTTAVLVFLFLQILFIINIFASITKKFCNSAS